MPNFDQYYILDDEHRPVPTSYKEFCLWRVAGLVDESDGRRVAEDTIDGIWVSTVFLGFDHRFGEGLPLLFETAIFPKGPGKGGADIIKRYVSWDDALTGHTVVVKHLKEKTNAQANKPDCA